MASDISDKLFFNLNFMELLKRNNAAHNQWTDKQKLELINYILGR